MKRPPATVGHDHIETIEGHRVSPAQTQYDAPATTQYRPAPPPQNPPSQHPTGAAPIYVTQQVQVASPVILRPPKSVGLAILLAVLFGPLGLFYASALGGIVMLIGGIIAVAATSGVAGPFVWIACAVWAGIAASNHNAAARAAYGAPTQINRY